MRRPSGFPSPCSWRISTRLRFRADAADGAALLRLPGREGLDWDTMASAMEGFRRGYREFLLLGGTGGRLDHTVANFAVLYYLLRRGARAVMADTHNRVELKLPGSYRLEPEEGYKFSLFPYAGEVTGLTERQVYYPLDNATLTPIIRSG